MSDVPFVVHAAKKVWAVEMSCLWLDNHRRKEEEKTGKYMYGPFRWKLRQQYLMYQIEQCNIIIGGMGRVVKGA